MSAKTPFGERRVTQPVVSAGQCRAARGLLNWTQKQLADEAGVARKTIADLEGGARLLRHRTRRDITHALEHAGVEFLWSSGSDGEGVRMAHVRPAFLRPRAHFAAGERPNPPDSSGRK